jgi:hypothetical protein
MLLVECNTVCGFIPTIRSGAQFATDSHLGGEADDPDTYLVADQNIDGLMYISGVGRKEGAEDDQHFSGTMAGCVAVVAC